MSRAREIADLGSPAASGLSNINLAMNGAMTINQRGTQTGIRNSFGIDRFRSTGTGAQIFTFSQSTEVPSGQGFSYSLKLDVTTADTSVAAGDYNMVQHLFEGQDLQHLKYGTSSAESLTLQFWVRSSKTGTHIVELKIQDVNYYNAQIYTIASANTWQKVILTFSGYQTSAITNDNTNGFGINWWLMAGSTYSGGTLASNTWQNTAANRAAGQVNVADSTSNEFYITGVQLEAGDVATPFEHEDIGTTLAKCQRYYETIQVANYFVTGNSYSTTQMNAAPMFFRTTKRSTPAITFPTIGTISGTIGVTNAQAGYVTQGSTLRSYSTNEWFQIYNNSGDGFSGMTDDGVCQIYSYGYNYIKADSEL